MTQASNAGAAGTGSPTAGAQTAGAQSAGAPNAGAPSAGAQSAGVLDQAKDTAQNLAGQVKEQVGQRAQTGFDQAKTRAADALTGIAQTLRMTTKQLQEQKQAAFATPYVDRAAGQVEQAANYVRTADVQELMERTEDIARQQPAIFLGALFAAGLAGARFLKSSRRNETQQSAGSTGRSYPNYGSGSYGGRSGGAASAGYGASYSGTSTAGTGSAVDSSMGTGSMGTGTAGTGTMGTGSSAGTPSTGGSGLSGGAGLGTSGRGTV